MHHSGNGRNLFYPTHRGGVKIFKLSETLLQSRLKENEEVAESWNLVGHRGRRVNLYVYK
jgi:hypothetical protein